MRVLGNVFWGGKRVYPILLFVSWVIGGVLQAATFTVSSTSDSGPGTLRQAMKEANATPGADVISFSISGLPPFVIELEDDLPAITDPVRIDGRTQPGFTNGPLIEVSGRKAGKLDGIMITAGQSEIWGLAINGFNHYGIWLETGGSNVIQNNHLGTDAAGLTAVGNQDTGVMVWNSVGNLVAGNLISGGNVVAVRLEGSLSSNNVVRGNRIGTDVSGTLDLGNSGNGVIISAARGNWIGGTNIAARNIVSGNDQNGIFLFNGARENIIQGNLVGTDITGTRAVPNLVNGICIFGATATVVGGTQPGAGNLVSGNGTQGILIANGSTENRVEGNRIGTDPDGAVALPNGLSGVAIVGSPGNKVGGSSLGARNILSGNRQSGVAILEEGATGNTVEGNFIGVAASGATALGNLLSGITIVGATANVIGGVDPLARNVISGNKLDGVTISDTPAAGATVLGNYIGLDFTGEQAISNAFAGVFLINSAANQIGGLSAGARNVISGNGQSGILITGSTSASNRVQGNYIGTAASGMIDVANEYAGVFIDDAPNNLIGGSVPAARNVISGNVNNGVNIRGRDAAGNRVSGNYIGLNALGSDGVGNTWRGVGILGSPNNIIGGLAPGEGNIISANWDGGIFIDGSGADHNRVQGNYIGVQSDLATPLGNGTHGVQIDGGASFNIIGGVEPGAANTIANVISRQYDGVRVFFEAGRGNTIYGNSIYLNAGLGIDLATDGVTANDSKDPDAGGNMGQNYPVITQAIARQSGLAIKGLLDSSPSGTFLIQFFLNSREYPGGYGQGEKYIGGTTVQADTSGHAEFEVNLGSSEGIFVNVTATATDGAGNSSEFSRSQRIESRQPPIAWKNPAEIVYGTALDASQLNATAAVAGTFSYSPAAGTILQAGGQRLNVVFTPEDRANLEPASASVVLNVKRAPLIIRADDVSMTAGGTLPVLTARYQGFVNNDTPAHLTAPAALATTALPSSLAGTFPITVSGAASVNYDITFLPGTLTVSPLTSTFITGAMQRDGFALRLEKLPAGSFSLESSTNLVSWTRLALLINGQFGSSSYLDDDLVGKSKKFYRVVALSLL